MPRRRIIVPFHVWTLFCSLSLSSRARTSSCILPPGKYWEIGEARSRWVEGNERARSSSRRRDGGCWKIWNRCCTNHMGAVAFQFGQISRTIFLNITKTNYPGPWCMFLLLWKTIKLYKWFMPFHAAIFSLWISKVPPPLCLKLWHLCSENLLDAFPVNPLTVFLYKHVFERTRKKQISLQTSSERLGWVEGLWWSQLPPFFFFVLFLNFGEGARECSCCTEQPAGRLRRASRTPDLWLQVICLIIQLLFGFVN